MELFVSPLWRFVGVHCSLDESCRITTRLEYSWNKWCQSFMIWPGASMISQTCMCISSQQSFDDACLNVLWGGTCWFVLVCSRLQPDSATTSTTRNGIVPLFSTSIVNWIVGCMLLMCCRNQLRWHEAACSEKVYHLHTFFEMLATIGDSGDPIALSFCRYSIVCQNKTSYSIHGCSSSMMDYVLIVDLLGSVLSKFSYLLITLPKTGMFVHIVWAHRTATPMDHYDLLTKHLACDFMIWSLLMGNSFGYSWRRPLSLLHLRTCECWHCDSELSMQSFSHTFGMVCVSLREVFVVGKRVPAAWLCRQQYFYKSLDTNILLSLNFLMWILTPNLQCSYHPKLPMSCWSGNQWIVFSKDLLLSKSTACV